MKRIFGLFLFMFLIVAFPLEAMSAPIQVTQVDPQMNSITLWGDLKGPVAWVSIVSKTQGESIQRIVFSPNKKITWMLSPTYVRYNDPLEKFRFNGSEGLFYGKDGRPLKSKGNQYHYDDQGKTFEVIDEGKLVAFGNLDRSGNIGILHLATQGSKTDGVIKNYYEYKYDQEKKVIWAKQNFTNKENRYFLVERFYNDKGQLTSSKQTYSNEGKESVTIRYFVYNSEGLLLESYERFERGGILGGRYKTIYTYKDFDEYGNWRTRVGRRFSVMLDGMIPIYKEEESVKREIIYFDLHEEEKGC